MANFVVTTEADVVDANDGVLSLREAVTAAQDQAEADTISFASTVNTVTLSNSLNITTSSSEGALTINGDNTGDGVADVSITENDVLGRPVMAVSGDGILNIENLNFSNISMPSATGSSYIIGSTMSVIRNNGAELNLTRVSFSNIDLGNFDNALGSLLDGGTGSTGDNGTDRQTVAGFHGFDGTDGEDGGNGVPGRDAPDLAAVYNVSGTLTLQDVVLGDGINVVGANGGNGGMGGQGGRGGHGADGPDAIFGIPSTIGGDGGNGGNGGNGGTGGNGGDGANATTGFANFGTIVANTVIGGHTSAATGTAGAAGGAGPGGSGGARGNRGEGGAPAFLTAGGSDGSNGSAGSTGAAGTAGDAGVFDPYLQNLGSGTGTVNFVNTLIYIVDLNGLFIEGNTITFSIVRGGNTDTAVDVSWALSAFDGFSSADLVAGSATSGTVSFLANGSNVQTVTLTTLADTVVEAVENFEFRLSDATHTSSTSNTIGLGTSVAHAAVQNNNVPTPNDDIFIGGPGNDEIDLLAGNDRFNAGDGDDTVFGNAGNDRLLGEAGNDTLFGGDGTDTLNGGDGDDFIFGGETTADLRDLVFAGAGNDSIDAGYGNDEVFGQDGNDTIAGGFGSDTLQGQNGDDVITGSALSDLVFGNAGNDFVNGGFGHDRINGGTGADRFYHLGIRDHGSDFIQDYSATEGDTLLSGIAGARRSDFQVNFNDAVAPDGEAAGDDNVQEAFVIYRPTGQILWALIDGGGQSSINLEIGGTTFDLLA